MMTDDRSLRERQKNLLGRPQEPALIETACLVLYVHMLSYAALDRTMSHRIPHSDNKFRAVRIPQV